MTTRLMMRTFLYAALLLLPVLVLLYGFSGHTAPDDQPVLAGIDAIVEDEMIKQNIVGCAVGIVQNGKITHLKGYGHRDMDRKTPFATNTVLRWASISKTLTAVAAFQVMEKSNPKMSLSTKVRNVVNYWPASGNKDDITIAHLLTHRSGINHYDSYDKSKYKANNNYNAKQAVEVFASASLNNTPGSKYEYTTFGFNLLGAAVNETCGSNYVDFIQDNIGKPLGMTSLNAYSNDPGGYSKGCDCELVSNPEGDTEWKLPGGGWASNVGDLTRFMQGLVNGKLLKNTAALWQSVSGQNYSYGVVRSSDGNGELRILHNGAHDNVRTQMTFYPGKKDGVVVMINGGTGHDQDRLSKRIERAIGKSFNVKTASTNFCSKDKDKKCISGCKTDALFAVWRKGAEDVIIRNGYTNNGFHAEWQWLVDHGYYCDNIETYQDGNTRKWNGLFRKKNGGAYLWRNFDHDGFHKKWEDMNKEGYRLVDIETYEDGGKRKWAGVFVKGSGKYALWRNFDTDGFAKKREEMAKQGLKLIDVEVFVSGGKLLWSGVWRAGNDGLLNRNYDTDDFEKLFSDRHKQGWKLVDVETYVVGGKRKWAGIWEKTSAGQYFYYGLKGCDIMDKHNANLAAGYEMTNMEHY